MKLYNFLTTIPSFAMWAGILPWPSFGNRCSGMVKYLTEAVITRAIFHGSSPAPCNKLDLGEARFFGFF